MMMLLYDKISPAVAFVVVVVVIVVLSSLLFLLLMFYDEKTVVPAVVLVRHLIVTGVLNRNPRVQEGFPLIFSNGLLCFSFFAP